MRSSTLNTNNIKIFNPVLCEQFYGDCTMTNNNEWPLEIATCDYGTSGTCLYPRGGFTVTNENYTDLVTHLVTQVPLGLLDATKISIQTYYPYLDGLTRYNPRITSAVQDMYQNCFYPSNGPAPNNP
jgi:hypothetical protein